jgi:hypothetical protein
MPGICAATASGSLLRSGNPIEPSRKSLGPCSASVLPLSSLLSRLLAPRHNPAWCRAHHGDEFLPDLFKERVRQRGRKPTLRSPRTAGRRSASIGRCNPSACDCKRLRALSAVRTRLEGVAINRTAADKEGGLHPPYGHYQAVPVEDLQKAASHFQLSPLL